MKTSFLGVLFIIFLTLKLAQVGVVAHWSWWWVFLPLWLPVGFALLLTSLYLLANSSKDD